MSKKQVNVRLDEHLIEKIQQSGITQTEFIEKACNNFVNESKKIINEPIDKEIKRVTIQF